MSVNKNANIPGYNQRGWFSRRSITNIIALKNLTKQYIYTYDINYDMFIVHREGTGLPNMESIINNSGLH